ncbi:ran-specific gtpase-activating protein [Anaeramoeba flamelloides]|uniref:Ran-specific gtpase-activating protein n=1 Tax=Anaeramoeba flamelloides TaxID=1746091 RepID=A0ABQ8Z6I9_9EUKA|nr:ran-specific gtpase-activating protein [Anaeramoeba flamelloides]
MYKDISFKEFRQKAPLRPLSKRSFQTTTEELSLKKEQKKWEKIQKSKIEERKRILQTKINELKGKKEFGSFPKIPSCFQTKKKKKTNPNKQKQTTKEKEENSPKISSPLRTEIRSQPTQEFEINNKFFLKKPNSKINNLILGTIPKKNYPIEKKQERKKLFQTSSLQSKNPRSESQKNSIFDNKATNVIEKTIFNTKNENKSRNPNLISKISTTNNSGSKIEIESNENEKQIENEQKKPIEIEKETDKELKPKTKLVNTPSLFQNTKKTGIFSPRGQGFKSRLFPNTTKNNTKPLNSLFTKKSNTSNTNSTTTKPTNTNTNTNTNKILTGLIPKTNQNLKSGLFSGTKLNTSTKSITTSATTKSTTSVLGFLSKQNNKKPPVSTFSKIGNKSKIGLFQKSELVKSNTGNDTIKKKGLFSGNNNKKSLFSFGKNKTSDTTKAGANPFSGISTKKKSVSLFSSKPSLFKKSSLFDNRVSKTTPITPEKQETPNGNKEDKPENSGKQDNNKEEEEEEEDGTIILKKIVKVFELVDQVKKSEIEKENQQKLMKSGNSAGNSKSKETNSKPPVWKWEERGVGNLMVIERSDKNGFNLMMRRNPTKKIVINAPLFSGLNVKRNKKSLILNLKNYISQSSVENESVGFTSFTIRTKTELDAQDIENEINKIVK